MVPKPKYCEKHTFVGVFTFVKVNSPCVVLLERLFMCLHPFSVLLVGDPILKKDHVDINITVVNYLIFKNYFWFESFITYESTF